MSRTARVCPKHGEHDCFIFRGEYRDPEIFFNLLDKAKNKLKLITTNCFCQYCIDELADTGIWPQAPMSKCEKHGEHDSFMLRGTSMKPEDYIRIEEDEGKKVTIWCKNAFCMICIDEWLNKGLLAPMEFKRRQK